MMKSNMKRIKIEKQNKNNIFHNLRKKYNKILNKKKKTRKRKTKNYFRISTILFFIISIVFVITLIKFIQKYISRKNKISPYAENKSGNKFDYNNL